MSLRAKRTVQRFGGAVVNPISRFIIMKNLPIPPLRSNALVVEHIGRRTGTVRYTPMGFVRERSGDLLVVAEHGMGADWLRNALAAGHVKVHVGGQVSEMFPQPLLDEDPYAVWAQMRSRSVAGMGKALAHHPVVVRFSPSRTRPSGSIDGKNERSG